MSMRWFDGGLKLRAVIVNTLLMEIEPLFDCV